MGKAEEANGPESGWVYRVTAAAYARRRDLTLAAILLGVAIWACFHFGFIVWHVFITQDEWAIGIVKQHYAAIIVLPSLGYSALCLVLFLEWRYDPIKFEVVGFKFDGAAGPIVLWICCFLAMAVATKLLW